MPICAITKRAGIIFAQSTENKEHSLVKMNINYRLFVIFISFTLGGCSPTSNDTLVVTAHDWNLNIPISKQSKVITNQSFLIATGSDQYLGLTVEPVPSSETESSSLEFITLLFGPNTIPTNEDMTKSKKLYTKNIVMEQQIDLDMGAAFYSKDNKNIERIVFATSSEDRFYYVLESKGYDLISIFNAMHKRI